MSQENREFIEDLKTSAIIYAVGLLFCSFINIIQLI
jgi:hypothetical protein